MDDSKYCFIETIKERRSEASGAYHVKGKTKRSGKPKDLKVSESLYKKNCGEVKNFNLNSPMSFDEFKQLPDDLKKEYLNKLVTCIHMNTSIIAKMFKCSNTTIRNIIKKLNIKLNMKSGSVLSTDRKLWNEFFSKDKRFSNCIVIKENKTKTKAKKTSTKDNKVKEKEVKKIPMVVETTIRITAKSYEDIIEQLFTLIDSKIPDEKLIIEVINGK